MKNADISYTNQAATVASALIEAKKHDDQATSCREEANKLIASLHKSKVVVGRYNSCAVATAFVDTLVQGGLAKKTAQNYLTLFKDAVKTGKPVADWGGTKAGGRKDVKGKAPKQDRENPALDALFKCMKAEGGLDVLHLMQASYDDAEGDLVEIAIELLKAEGYEIE
jgi:ribosomal protein S7